ncbi:HI1506-related protein [Chromobacterium subtsugae]|uniref:HI1506-related protein n=1 Tax=Chromobacterium subtsugae TaxID=251747 RepID=UPI000640D371|nr:HI1506-related protein [Chromobacterium subtsugae]
MNSVDVLRVSARVDGYRAAGLQFHRREADVPVELLTVNQIAALQDDPMLETQRIRVPLIPAAPISTPEHVGYPREHAVELERLAEVGREIEAMVPGSWGGGPAGYMAYLASELALLQVAAQAQEPADVAEGQATPDEAAAETEQASADAVSGDVNLGQADLAPAGDPAVAEAARPASKKGRH